MSTLEAWRLPYVGSSRRQVAVTVLACGSTNRGDEGVAVTACRRLRSRLPADAIVRIVGELDVDDLLAIPDRSAVLVVDAARGLRPGAIRCLPLGGLLTTPGTIRPRSSHALTMPEVIGLADMIRGHPLRGCIVLIGGRIFGLGEPLSERVADRLGAFEVAILTAIADLSPNRHTPNEAPLVRA